MEQALHLPETCGVILLADCTLFPHGALPLHIFEDRYRQMLNDALEGNCIFAVGRRIYEDDENLNLSASPVGTIGLIRASRETEDGTSNLILHGIMRVRFTNWRNDEKPYPYADIKPIISPDIDKTAEEYFQERLRTSMRSILEKFDSEVRSYVENMMEQAHDPYILSDMISQQFIHDPDDRQNLLETKDLKVRVPIIEKLLKKIVL